MTPAKNTHKTGTSARMVPAGSRAGALASGAKVEPDIMASGADRNIQENPPARAPERHRTTAGDTAVIIHDRDGGDAEQVISMYLRSSGIIHRAMRLFEEWEYQPARISSSKIPVDILAIRGDAVLLVQVISSRAAILDAAALTAQHREKIQNLRQMGTSRQFRKVLLAHSANNGWKYYDVLPGGLIPAWDLPDMQAR